MSTAVGSFIGRFRVESMIGRGGMGEVYRCHDEILDRTVALKTIRHERESSPVQKARFLREARSLSKLDHPNICRIFDFFPGEGKDYLVLEYVDGDTLNKVKLEDWSLERKLELSAQIANALAAAHANEIIHRDLKPENIMINRAGEIKILDFGLARSDQDPNQEVHEGSLDEVSSDQLTHHGAVIGTLSYMSPEQAMGIQATPASDLYSFGILLIEILTGCPAYPQDLSTPALYFHVAHAKTRESNHKEISTPLKLLFSELTSKDPEKRPAAREVAMRLQLQLDAIRTKRRPKWLLVATLLALGLTAFFANTWLNNRAKHTSDPNQIRRLAVFPFENETGEKAMEWARLGLMELANQVLDNTSGLESIPSETLMTRMSQALQNDNHSLADSMGLNYVIRSTLRKHGGLFQLTTTVDGEVQFTQTISDPSATGATMKMINRIAYRLGYKNGGLSEGLGSDPYLSQTYALGVAQLLAEGHTSAIDFFRVCNTLDPNFVEAQLQLATCYRRTGEHGLSRETSQAILDSPHSTQVHKSKALVALGFNDLSIGYLDQAFDAFTQALQLSTQPLDVAIFADCYRGLAQVAKHRGDLAQAGDYIQLSLDLAEASGDLWDQASSWHKMGGLARENHKLELAETYYTRALDIRRRIGDAAGESSSWRALSSLATRRGDLDTALAMLESSIQASQRLGDDHAIAIAHSRMASVYGRVPNLAKAESLFMQTLEHYKHSGSLIRLGTAWNNLGWVHVTTEQFDQAEYELGEALALFSQSDSDLYIANVLLSLGEIALFSDRHEESQALLEEAHRINVSRNHPLGTARSHHHLAVWCALNRQPNLSEAHFEQALDRYCQLDNGDGYARAVLDYLKVGPARTGSTTVHADLVANAMSVRSYDRLKHEIMAYDFYQRGLFTEALQAMRAAQEASGDSWNSEQRAFLNKLQDKLR